MAEQKVEPKVVPKVNQKEPEQREPTTDEMQKARDFEIIIYNRKLKELIDSMNSIVAIDNALFIKLKENTKK